MRRFQISTPNLKEPASIVYDTNGVLCSFSVIGCGMTDNQVFAFKQMIPVKIENIEAAFAAHKGVTIVEADFEVTFLMFWLKYNKKINKARCEPLWVKLNKVDQVKAFYGVEDYDKFLKSISWNRTKADPENYLRNKMWENEWK